MKKYIVFILSLFLSLQLNAQVSVKKYIVISEVMYDSPLNEQIAQGIPYSNGEYIELYNLENTAVDLTGWKLTGGGKTEIYQFPANTIINPRSTLIVAYQYKDSGFLLNDLYSYDGYEMTTILYQRKIILSNSGETVSVVDNVGNVVDYITYDGTSNKTKPNRLSATNEDGTAGDHCKSLHRSLVLFDETNNIIFDPTHWKTELGNLFEVQIESPIDLPSQNKNYVLETTYTSSQSGRSCITYYDGLGRPCQTIDIAASPVNSQNIVSFVEYDCMGRNDSIVYLPYVTKSQSITFRQNPLNEQTNFYQNIYAYDYKYDIEGQNTSGKSSLFDYEICMISPNGNFTSRYDHKPALFVWNRHDSDNSSGYKYDYDLTGQLKTAAYIQRAQNDENWGESSAFNERDIEYDKNGNILQMKRTDSTGNRLHDLAYIYRGNQLISFSCNDQVYEGYTYDASGNLTYDPYSNIHIEYNELNLPSRIFDDNKEVRYIYSADGQKLKTIADGSFTYYRSTMIYGGSPGSGEQLLYILHPEGMAVNENGTFAYKYNLTDYMGNVRTYAVADRSSETLLEEQVLDYYPFGLAHSYNNLHKNRYLFSGKELQDASLGRHGFLELYDFGARYYNPMSGRWFNPDPALQTVNPYLFCGNTPMVYIDQDGEFFFTILNAIKDFFHGLFTWNWSSENWHSTVMAFKIDMGWFQGNFGQILSRFTWELPQTLFGHLGSQTENLFEGVKSVSYYGGATAVETYSAKWGGFTLGSFIIGHRGLHADPNNSLFQHEYGHYLQSRASGPLYLGKYAIPSFYDTMFGRGNHKYHSVEQDANARAIKYFEKRIPGFADRRNKGINEGWDHYKYPIVGYDVQGGFYSARSQAALDRAHIPAFESPLDAFVAVLSLNPVTSFGTGAIYQTPYNTRKNNNAYINENKCSIITR